MIGERTLIRKLWVKFEDMDVACVCEEHRKKCKDKECKEYVVKFTEIKRAERDEELDRLEKELVQDGKLIEKFAKDLKKHATELKKSINKFKI